MPTLRLQLPGKEAVSYPLTGAKVTLGRRPENTIQVLDPSISAYHAEFLYVDGHYRLHDLGSLNFSFVEGTAILEFHLRTACKLAFGHVQAEYDVAEADPRLNAVQMEKDMTFLRNQNLELQQKVDELQRKIDILSSARLITTRSDAVAAATPVETRRLLVERDELRFQNSGLRMELEHLREEVLAVTRERDQARLRETGASFKVLDPPSTGLPRAS